MKILPVPYYSQEDPNARWGNNDCGIACVYMVIHYHRLLKSLKPLSTSIDFMAQRILGSKSAFATTLHLVNLGAMYGVNLDSTDARYADQRLTVPRMIDEVNEEHPSIALIGYEAITHRQNQAFKGGHYVVVVGYDDVHKDIIVNDPDFYGDRRYEGQNLRIPYEMMVKAIAPHPPWFSVGSQGVFYKGAL